MRELFERNYNFLKNLSVFLNNLIAIFITFVQGNFRVGNELIKINQYNSFK